MLNVRKLSRPLYMAVYPIKEFLGQYDVPKNPVAENIENTPMGRIRKIFVSTEYQPISKEIQHFINFTSTATFIGMMVGGVAHSRGVAQQFIDNNEATRFYTQHDARRYLQDKVILAFGKGAFKFGWRLCVFCGIYETIRVLLTAYYGEPSVLHYMIGAGTAGFLFKLSLGVKGSLVGLVVGTILGAIGGLFSIMFIKITGMSKDDFERIQYYWAYKRDEAFKQAMGKRLEEEHGQVKELYEANKANQAMLSSAEINNKEVDK
ncbi:PREDICTED: RPII140-upstream gene protein [Polistes dominula]|uniref:Complex I assembly factor TIMMDC1, mitochondrial n=1 Tax=Polistes dominula TaxID=743375 RepID=A0ABM1IIJ6_POLDO|nr:PREDICTED: RPII140-upstream gene protein [Polistes dominula]